MIAPVGGAPDGGDGVDWAIEYQPGTRHARRADDHPAAAPAPSRCRSRCGRSTTSPWSGSATSTRCGATACRRRRRRRRRVVGARRPRSGRAAQPAHPGRLRSHLRRAPRHRRPRAAHHRPARQVGVPRAARHGADKRADGASERATGGSLRSPLVGPRYASASPCRAGGGASTPTSSAQMRASRSRAAGVVERFEVRVQAGQRGAQVAVARLQGADQQRGLARRRERASSRVGDHVARRRRAAPRARRSPPPAAPRRDRTPAAIIIDSAPASWSVWPA